MFKVPKMAIGVGDEEVEFIKQRYEEFKELIESVKIRLGHKCSAYKEDCTFRKFESGNRLSY